MHQDCKQRHEPTSNKFKNQIKNYQKLKPVAYILNKPGITPTPRHHLAATRTIHSIEKLAKN